MYCFLHNKLSNKYSPCKPWLPLNFLFPLLAKLPIVIVMETISREFRVALLWELLYADDLVVIAETEQDLIKKLYEWKNNVQNRGMRVNMNKTKVMISGERQKPLQKAAR